MLDNADYFFSSSLQRGTLSTVEPSAATASQTTGVNTKILPTLRHIATHEGARALFSGFVPRTMWIGLGGAVFLGTFEAGIKVIEGDV